MLLGRQLPPPPPPRQQVAEVARRNRSGIRAATCRAAAGSAASERRRKDTFALFWEGSVALRVVLEIRYKKLVLFALISSARRCTSDAPKSRANDDDAQRNARNTINN